MKSTRDSAVSPVIGILLMLVVTLIIAAVVSAFAGGLVKDEKKTPQASFELTTNINSIEGESNGDGLTWTYPSGYTEDNNYIEFEHKGGDTVVLDDILVQFQYQDTTFTLGTDTKPNQSASVSCRSTPYPTTYFKQVGENDGVVSTGDKFRIIADGNYGYTYNGKYSEIIFFVEDGNAASMGGGAINVNEQESYKIIDRNSGKIIQTGTFVPIH